MPSWAEMSPGHHKTLSTTKRGLFYVCLFYILRPIMEKFVLKDATALVLVVVLRWDTPLMVLVIVAQRP